MKCIFSKLKTELLIYFILWICSVSYSIYQSVKVENEYFGKNFEDTYNDFSSGWNWIKRKQDISDVEWKYGLTLLRELFPWYLIHCAVAELLRYTNNKQLLIFWYIIISLSFMLHKFSIIIGIYFVIQPIFGYIILQLNSKLAIWLYNIVSLLIINFYTYFNLEFSNINNYDAHVAISTIAWTNLRCLNYLLEAVNSEKMRKFNVINLSIICSYCFYLPLMYFGPLLLFTEFKNSLDKSNLEDLFSRIRNLFIRCIRFFWWLFFTEFVLHFVYVNALTYQPQIISSMDLWPLYGLGYCMGQFFQLKYVVFYGFSTALANFEGITVPRIPICIGRVHLYSDMWKYFDRGLYNFLLRYIYIPLSGDKNKTTLISKLLASFFCFLYVYIWHGIQYFVGIWSLLNYLGIIIETFCSGISQTSLYKSKITKNLSPEMHRRFKCFLATPLFAMSALSNFYFFAGKEVGNIYIRRFLQTPAYATFNLLIILYFGSQVSTEIKLWEQNHKMNINKKHIY